MSRTGDPARQLADGIAALGLVVDAAAQARLLAYLALLYKWNRTYSLTALREEDEAVGQHLLDSLAILPWVPAGTLLDVGSGGGTPGIPLAIVRPALAVTLLDSNSKKAAFLRQAAIELELPNVAVHGGRVEQYHPAGGFAAVASRAFADLAQFTALSRHLLAPGGVWLAMKGTRPQAEIDALPPDVRVDSVLALQVPDVAAQRHLVVMRSQAA